MCEEDDHPGEPVCLAGKLVAGHVVDPQTWRDVSRFRKSERARLYAARKSMTPAGREETTARILVRLRNLLEGHRNGKLAFYWPIRGEPDLRPLMRELDECGCTVLLPVVAARGADLVFRRWRPGCPMARDIWNIPGPAEGPALAPDAVIAPLLGFDTDSFRLGNGGGYYDRTLASLSKRPYAVGVGYEHGRMASIFPMPWDVRMDMILTEQN